MLLLDFFHLGLCHDRRLLPRWDLGHGLYLWNWGRLNPIVGWVIPTIRPRLGLAGVDQVQDDLSLAQDLCRTGHGHGIPVRCDLNRTQIQLRQGGLGLVRRNGLQCKDLRL